MNTQINMYMRHVAQVVVTFAFVFAFVGLAQAESDNYTASDLEDIKAQAYATVENKWQIELEFANDGEYEFYLYEIEDNDELHTAIADKIEDKYNFSFSASEVSDIIEYEDEDEHKDEDEDDDDNELEIEAERYEDIEGKWEVEYESGDKEEHFYVYEVEDEDDLIAKIADHLDMSIEEVADVLEVDEDEWEEEEDEDDDDKKDKKDKDDKDNGNIVSKIASGDRDDMIQTLLLLIITMLLQGEGDFSGVNISDLLSDLN